MMKELVSALGAVNPAQIQALIQQAHAEIAAFKEGYPKTVQYFDTRLNKLEAQNVALFIMLEEMGLTLPTPEQVAEYIKAHQS